MTSNDIARKLCACVAMFCLVLGGTSALAASASYTYDTLGRLTCVAYPDGTGASFGYDASGNRVAQNNSASCPGGGGGGGGQPDLTVTAAPTPTSAVQNVAVTLQGTVLNVGGGTASGFVDQFELRDANLNCTAPFCANINTASATLAGGTPLGRSVSYTFTSTGTYALRLCADINGNVAESNETNNCGPWASVAVTAPTSQAPVANNVSVNVPYNSSSFAIPLNITGGAPIKVAVSSSASHGIAVANGTSINYTPASGFQGADSFQYTATNNYGTSAPATASITVKANAPVANPDSYTMTENTTLSFDPLTNDTDPNLGYQPDVIAVGTPSHGSATVINAGQINYTPTTGYTGTDTFSYTIDDSLAQATGTITITVSANPDHAPVANPDTLVLRKTIGINQSWVPAGSLDPRTNDTDADGDPLTITSYTQGARGTVIPAGGGGLSYTYNTSINSNFTDTDSFTYTISDGRGMSSTATVTVNITVNTTQ